MRFLVLNTAPGDRSLRLVSSKVRVRGRTDVPEPVPAAAAAAAAASLPGAAVCPLLRLPLRPSIPEDDDDDVVACTAPLAFLLLLPAEAVCCFLASGSTRSRANRRDLDEVRPPAGGGLEDDGAPEAEAACAALPPVMVVVVPKVTGCPSMVYGKKARSKDLVPRSGTGLSAAAAASLRPGSSGVTVRIVAGLGEGECSDCGGC